MPPGPPPDEDLLRCVAKGDRAAFEMLAARHMGRAYGVALRILDDPAEAEDIAQEALLRLWRHAGSYDPARGRPSTWLHSIVVNLAIDRTRRAGPRLLGLDSAEDLPDAAPDPLAALQAGSRQAALAAAVQALPERQRQAINLTYFGELGAAEAAGALNISARALEGLLHRGRAFLRRRLETARA